MGGGSGKKRKGSWQKPKGNDWRRKKTYSVTEEKAVLDD